MLIAWQLATSSRAGESLTYQHLAWRNENEHKPHQRDAKLVFLKNLFPAKSKQLLSIKSAYAVLKKISTIPVPESAFLQRNSLTDSYAETSPYRRSAELGQTDSRNIQMQQLYPTENMFLEAHQHHPCNHS